MPHPHRVMGALTTNDLTVATLPSGPLITTFLLDLHEVATPPIPEMSPEIGSNSQSAGHSDLAIKVTSAPVSNILSLLIFSPLENKLDFTMGFLVPMICTH